MVIALLVMIGWISGIDVLMRVAPHFVSMKFNTALSFGLAGAALWQRETVPFRLGLSFAVALIGGLTLGEYGLGVDWGIDQLLISESEEGLLFPGRMSPLTAIGLVLGGLALMLMTPRAAVWRRSAEILAIGLVALMGYALAGSDSHAA